MPLTGEPRLREIGLLMDQGARGARVLTCNGQCRPQPICLGRVRRTRLFFNSTVMRLASRLTIAIAAPLMIACQDSSTAPNVLDSEVQLAKGGNKDCHLPHRTTSISLTPDVAEILTTGSIEITAYNQSQDEIPDCAMQWSTSDPDVATVSDDGRVTAVGPGGPITITARTKAKHLIGIARIVVAGTPTVHGSLAVGYHHTCALTAVGEAYCWGSNNHGQLGDESLTHRSTPTAVSGGLRFVQLTAGVWHTCGLTAEGKAYCWGANVDGALGTGTTSSQTSPTAVIGNLSFELLEAGGNHTCGISTSGGTYCWGANESGQLGVGLFSIPSNFPRSPTLVVGGERFTTLTAGLQHTCGISTNGTWCWGSNFQGQLGDQTNTDRSVPTPVSGGQIYQAVSSGAFHTCAKLSNAQWHCWGDNFYGQLGDGTVIDRTVPTPVAGSIAFARLDGATLNTCAVAISGSAFCWGTDRYDQFGNGTAGDSFTPTPVSGGLNFTRIGTGTQHTCGMTTLGTAYCWGHGDVGQIGNGILDIHSVPTAVAGGLTFAANVSVPE